MSANSIAIIKTNTIVPPTGKATDVLLIDDVPESMVQLRTNLWVRAISVPKGGKDVYWPNV